MKDRSRRRKLSAAGVWGCEASGIFEEQPIIAFGLECRCFKNRE